MRRLVMHREMWCTTDASRASSSPCSADASDGLAHSETINSERAQASSLQAARQSPVLLKNGNKAPILPLKKGVKLALIGPHTQTQKDLAGNYFENIGLGTCAGPTCVPKLGTAFDALNTGGGNANRGRHSHFHAPLCISLVIRRTKNHGA
jgi:beta-glucosidase-like glycosyl hydrolase